MEVICADELGWSTYDLGYRAREGFSTRYEAEAFIQTELVAHEGRARREDYRIVDLTRYDERVAQARWRLEVAIRAALSDDEGCGAQEDVDKALQELDALEAERKSGAPAMQPAPRTRFHIGADEWAGISKLIEECGEVVQVCGKLIATEGQVEHWEGTNLRRRLEEEIGDLLAAVSFVGEHGKLDMEAVEKRGHEKRELFDRWHAKQQGRE